MDYSELYGDVTPITGSVPRPTVIRSARNVVRTFCKQSRAYTMELLDQPHVDYTLQPTPPTDTRIWGAQDVELINPSRYTNPRVNFRFDEGEQRFYFERNIRDTDRLNLRLVLIPTRTATQCSDKIMETFYEVILAGVIHNVLTMPTESWFNPALAQQYGAAFAAGIEDAINRARNDDNPGPRVCSYGGY